ncbi:hypothetical protein PAMP_003146 [Pampus punctatissimus]
MYHTLSFCTLLLPLLAFLRADALYGQMLVHCQFSSPDGHNVLYLEQYYFNKILMAQYNSTLAKMIGYTKKTKEIADFLNRDTKFINHQIWKTEVCKRNSRQVYTSGLLNPVEPYVWLRSVEAVSSKHPGMLVCSVYNFYPKQIRVTWLRNGKKVTSDVTSIEELSNGNWLYQVHYYLEYTPIPGEKITCMVEHASLMEPKLYDWKPTSPSGVSKIAVGIAGMLLGLVFSAAGLIYYKKKSAGRPEPIRPTPGRRARLRYRAAITRTMCLIRVCYKHRQTEKGKYPAAKQRREGFTKTAVLQWVSHCPSGCTVGQPTALLHQLSVHWLP